MDAATRRGAFCTLFGLGVAGVLAPRAVVAQTVAPTGADLPEGPLRLTRRIERSLRDGGHVAVERSWEVEFAHQGQGIAVRGRQVHVAVDAPPALAQLAAIEEGRSTADMWPILLTGSGLIIAAGSGARADDISRAVRVASDMITARPVPAAQAEREIHYLTQLAKAGSTLLDRLPDDLFFPAEGPMHSVQKVDLPGGLVGEFELNYEARTAVGRRWLASARREVVTRLAGTWQSAREDWSLGAG